MHGNVTDIFLSLKESDKLIIISGAVLFLLFVLLCLVCFLNPACCLHGLCLQKSTSSKKTYLQPGYGTLDDPFPISEKKGKLASPRHPVTPLRDSEETDWSDVNMADIIEMKQEPTDRHGKPPGVSDLSNSSQTFTSQVLSEIRLSYGLTFDRTSGKLHIKVLQLGNFPVTKPGGALAPYVKICVYRIPKYFFTFKPKATKELTRNHLISEAQTKIQRRTDSPIFNEMFSFDVEDKDISTHVIKFLVCDFDRFSRHLIIGEVVRDLAKAELSSGGEALFSDSLTMHQEEVLGELHVALMYLPTAEKLSVTILNAKGLLALEGPKRNAEIFVKVTFMYDGRPVKKIKTKTHTSEPNTVFNESFVFDVPPSQLDKVYFILAAIEVEKDRSDFQHLLGRVYLGVSFTSSTKAQWLEMVQSARKQVACWHKLQN